MWEKIMTCEGCKWHDDKETRVCTCADSEHCADFVNEGCKYYEAEGSMDSSGGEFTAFTQGVDAERCY